MCYDNEAYIPVLSVFYYSYLFMLPEEKILIKKFPTTIELMEVTSRII